MVNIWKSEILIKKTVFVTASTNIKFVAKYDCLNTYKSPKTCELKKKRHLSKLS